MPARPFQPGGVPAFGHRDPTDVIEFSRSRERVFRKGLDLLTQGDRPEAVYLIQTGLTKIVRNHPEGNEAIVALRGPGRFLGAAAALLGRDQPFTTSAMTDCRLTCFAVAEFRKLVRDDSVLSWRLHEMHSHELEESMVMLSEVRYLSARVRLSRLLLRVASWVRGIENPATEMVELPLKQWEMAQLVAVTPQYLCQMLHELEVEGRVRRVGHRVFWIPKGEARFGCCPVSSVPS